jgi:hypothetical protein
MWVVAEVLTLLGPSIRIKRVTDCTTDSSRREIDRCRAEDKDSGLVERNDHMETRLESLLDIAKVTHDLRVTSFWRRAVSQAR